MTETTTTFPVDPGTVVEVTCTYPDAVNEGGSEVTCTSVTSFNYVTEPSCEVLGMCAIPASLFERFNDEHRCLVFKSNEY